MSERACGWRGWLGGVLRTCALVASTSLTPTVLPGQPFPPASQGPQQGPDLDKLRAMLGQPGPDGRDQREAAIEQLLTLPAPAAQRVLQERLLLADDPDHVRESILIGLQRHLAGRAAQLFGGADVENRRQIVTGYVAALAPLWQTPGTAVEDLAQNPLRSAARLALQRVPVRELEGSARLLLAAGDAATAVPLFHCLADMQQVTLAPLLAEHVEDPVGAIATGARHALQLLTCNEREFATKAEFEQWYATYGTVRYVDLVENAARRGPRPAEVLREALAKLRVDAARDLVHALTSSTPGVDWAAVQVRTLTDDADVLDACLETLRDALAPGLPADDHPMPRQTFCRALVQRWRQTAVDQRARRALLLEVAAYCTRAEESELAAEVIGLLLAQLDAPDAETQVAALRGLRRFPTIETRARLVRTAMQLLPQGEATRAQVAAILATLASRNQPQWTSPTPSDPDKADWLQLVQAAARSPAELDLRTAALTLALTLDADTHRVPEVFDLLLDLAKDAGQDTRLRSTCLIQLQGWRDQQGSAEGWVKSLLGLLEDPAPQVRQLAAESLGRLPDSTDPRRAEWLADTIVAVRNRVRSEPNVTVLRALVDCMVSCGRQPQMPEKAIGAINKVLADLGNPVPAEHQFRLEPLLQALATIAADARSDRGQWLGACRQLLQFEKRQSLRLVLTSHGAVDLAKDVTSSDADMALRARQAMRVLIGAALFKPAKDPWTATEDLQREARDVRTAFVALDKLDEAQRFDDAQLKLDETAVRLLRLEVELAGGKNQEAAQRATAWLAGNGGPGRAAMTPEQRDRMRALAGEAQLALGKPDLALQLLADLPTPSSDLRIVDLAARVARALAATDAKGAAALAERVFRATTPEDPAFRARLVDWLRLRIAADPAQRGDAVAEAERHTALFAAQDCPSDLRKEFDDLRKAQ